VFKRKLSRFFKTAPWYNYSMLPLEQMFGRLCLSLLLGAILGIERELVGKEAGIRTQMLVAAGAAIFTMISISLPLIVSSGMGNLSGVISGNSGYLQVIANIVVGIGFLGGGVIIKADGHAHGITTAALVWTTAAIGILAGLGLVEFSVIATILITLILYILRAVSFSEPLEPQTSVSKKRSRATQA
jgi:putative Mg2+ transporter-C (MgtC) family protein